MQIKRVALINPREISSFFCLAEGSPAIATLSRILTEMDIPYVTFPYKEEDCDILDYKEKIKKFLIDNPSEIIGFSCWTSGYGMATDMAEIAHEIYPQSLIVAGGPHFSSEDEIKQSLENKEFDIVFRGGGSPFINFCAALYKNDAKFLKTDNGLELLGNIPKDGLCYIDKNNNIIIGNRGLLKEAISPVLEVGNDYADIRVIVKDVCPNRCDYCVIEPSMHTEDSFDKLLLYSKSLCQIIDDEINIPIRFALADSAPFANRKKLRPLLDKFRHVKNNASFSLFADPQDIDDDILNIIKEYNVTSLFFGRDRVIEDHILGRRFYGKIRTQATLDNEVEKIKKLIDFVSSNQKNNKCDIFLGYILSPFEDIVSSKKMTDEIKYFLDYGKGIVQTNLFILDPYPGTVVAEKVKGSYTPMRYFKHPYPNVWNGKSNIHLQMELTRLILSKLLCQPKGRELFTPFIDFIHKLQYEGIADTSFVLNIQDKDLKALGLYVMDSIAKMDFKYDIKSSKYKENIITIHLLGCMVIAMLNKRDWLQKRLFKEVMAGVKEYDGILPLLIEDLEMLSKGDKNG